MVALSSRTFAMVTCPAQSSRNATEAMLFPRVDFARSMHVFPESSIHGQFYSWLVDWAIVKLSHETRDNI